MIERCKRDSFIDPVWEQYKEDRIVDQYILEEAVNMFEQWLSFPVIGGYRFGIPVPRPYNGGCYTVFNQETARYHSNQIYILRDKQYNKLREAFEKGRNGQ